MRTNKQILLGILMLFGCQIHAQNVVYHTGSAVPGANVSAFGYLTLLSNTGNSNSAFGSKALWKNTTGDENTAVGHGALGLNFTGSRNTAVGWAALGGASFSGMHNVAVGVSSGNNLSTGNRNTHIGNGAGGHNSIGSSNIYLGYDAGKNYLTGSNSVFLGSVTVPHVPAVPGVSIGNNSNNIIVIGDGAGNHRILIDSLGNAGIGLTPVGRVPQNRMHISARTSNASGLRFERLNSSNTPSFASNGKVLTVNAAGDVVLTQDVGGPGSPDTNIYTHDGSIVSTNMSTAGVRTVTLDGHNLWFKTAEENGRVYIGEQGNFPVNTTGDYRLYVEGGILTEKVKVALETTADWADYVFGDNHKLMPLQDVETFIKANKHLPGIESAEELQKSGLDLADMQRKQMEKIEELTLHLIAQDKTIDKQSQEIEVLKAQMKILLSKINQQ